MSRMNIIHSHLHGTETHMSDYVTATPMPTPRDCTKRCRERGLGIIHHCIPGATHKAWDTAGVTRKLPQWSLAPFAMFLGLFFQEGRQVLSQQLWCSLGGGESSPLRMGFIFGNWGVFGAQTANKVGGGGRILSNNAERNHFLIKRARKLFSVRPGECRALGREHADVCTPPEAV